MKKTIGFIIIMLGILFMLSNFDLIVLDNIWNYLWTLAIIVIGIVGLMNKRRFDFFYITLILIGGMGLFKEFGLIDQSFINKTLGPVILIVLGLTFIMNYTSSYKRNGQKYMAIFSGIEEKIEDEKYIGNKMIAIFGGIELDLSQVKFKDKVKTINMIAIFGGIDIVIPTDVKVILNGVPILGGVDNKTNPKDSKYELIINYTIVCGGIEIKN